MLDKKYLQDLFTTLWIYICARFLSCILLDFTELVVIISKRSDSEESDYNLNCLILWRRRDKSFHLVYLLNTLVVMFNSTVQYINM